MDQSTKIESLSEISQLILEYAKTIDAYYDENTSYKTVALIAAIFFLTLRLSPLKRKHDFDLDGFVHAFITGIGSAMCVYLDYFVAEELSGTSEPLGMMRCQKPLTNLHMILPAITLGYSICDIINGLTMNLPKEFLAHGVVTFAASALYCENQMQQFATHMLVMELSTILLTLCKVEIFGPLTQGIIQLSFALMFFLCRVLAAPYIWFQIISTYYKESLINNGEFCFASYMICMNFITGLFFHCLNSYWFYKIVRKIQKNLFGNMEIQDTKVE